MIYYTCTYIITIDPLTGEKLLSQVILGANLKLSTPYALWETLNLTLATTALVRWFSSGLLSTFIFFPVVIFLHSLSLWSFPCTLTWQLLAALYREYYQHFFSNILSLFLTQPVPENLILHKCLLRNTTEPLLLWLQFLPSQKQVSREYTRTIWRAQSFCSSTHIKELQNI